MKSDGPEWIFQGSLYRWVGGLFTHSYPFLLGEFFLATATARRDFLSQIRD